MRRGVSFIATIAIVAMAACSSFGANVVELDGGPASPEGGGAEGGGPPATPIDGAADAGTEPPPCGSDYVAFCDPFERDTATPGMGWQKLGTGVGVAIDSLSSLSPTRS